MGSKSQPSRQLTRLNSFKQWLVQAYTTIVMPMVKDIKNLMKKYCLLHESELFVTDLKFCASQNEGQEYIGDPSKNKEDVVYEIQEELRKITKTY